MFKTISKCRVCGNAAIETVMSLGDLSLTGVFPKSRNENITSGPVDLVMCIGESTCGLVQLKQSYNIEEMYGDNYGYRSGLNKTMVAHLETKVAKILSMNVLEDNDVIIDIGSNDCTTLNAYPKNKFELYGIDPSALKFSAYYPPEIRLIPDFFSADLVKQNLAGKEAKVITSFAMFYDLESPVDFARQIEKSLAPEGIWVFEQSYLPFMLKMNSFDTICHEHLEFYSLKQINWITEAAGLKVLDVEFNGINGGSFSITAAKLSSSYIPNFENLNNILAEEEALGLSTSKVFNNFKVGVDESRRMLLDFLVTAKNNGQKVAGLGASTKGNVLLQYYGVNEQLLTKIGEVNPEKFGCFTPGSLIPLVPEDEVIESSIEYLLVLPWHFREFFLSQEKLKGKKLIFPLPNFEIVSL